GQTGDGSCEGLGLTSCDIRRGSGREGPASRELYGQPLFVGRRTLLNTGSNPQRDYYPYPRSAARCGGRRKSGYLLELLAPTTGAYYGHVTLFHVGKRR